MSWPEGLKIVLTRTLSRENQSVSMAARKSSLWTSHYIFMIVSDGQNGRIPENWGKHSGNSARLGFTGFHPS